MRIQLRLIRRNGDSNAIAVPFDDGLGECIVQDHPRLRGLPYIVVWTRAESRLGDAWACSENRLG
jgi:hypothetical protein